MNKIYSKVLTLSIFISLIIIFSSFSLAAQNISQCSNITSSGSYVLNQTINSSTTCLSIASNNIELDCNGNKIIYGTGGGNGAIGINASNGTIRYANLTIKNCVIIKSSSAGTTGYGILLNRFSNSSIYNNTILTNGTSDNYGIYLQNNSNNNEIYENYIQSKGTTTNNIGIYLSLGTSNTVIRNNNISTLGTGTNYGIYLLGTTVFNLNNNTVHSNNIITSGTVGAGGASNHGIYMVANVTRSTISSNNVTTNGTTTNHGIYLVGSAGAPVNDNEISNNTIESNGFAAATTNYGIYLQNNANNNNLTNNNITTFGTTANYGIYLSGTLLLGTNNNVISSNIIQKIRNVTTNNYGIYLVTNTNNNTINHNIISTNGTTGNIGIIISGTTATSIGNEVSNNTIIARGITTGNYGIYLATNASRNRITNNNITTRGTTTNHGIYLLGAAATPVNDNEISNNSIQIYGAGAAITSYGIIIQNLVNRNRIANNDITTRGTTGNYGIYLTGTAALAVNENIISENIIQTLGTTNNNHGIYLYSNTNSNNITNNIVSTNGTTTNYGIYILGTTTANVDYNIISENNISTLGTGASNHGIYLSTNASLNIVNNNNILVNGTTTNYGIYLLGAASANTDYNRIDSNNIIAVGTAAAVSNIGILLSTNLNYNNITNNTLSIYGTTNSQGIYLVGTAALASNNNMIYSNEILVNGSSPTAATNYGIYLTANVSSNNISNNNIITRGSTTGYGIYLLGSATAPLNYNIISNNNISTSGTGASNHGIYLTANTNSNNITNNIVSARGTATNYGIYLLGTTANRVNDNIISNNNISTSGTGASNHGIYINTNVTRNIISENTISVNGTTTNYGIYLGGVAGGPVNNTLVSNNTIDTLGIGASNHGIYISSLANQNTLINNNITTRGSATNYGIYLLGTTALSLNATEIINNNIQTLGNMTNNYGIYLLTNTNQNNITGNNVKTNGTNGNIGIAISGITIASINNDIISNILETSGNNTNYGIYLDNSSNNEIMFNTLLSNGTYYSSDALYVYRQSQNNNFTNNIILESKGNGINLVNTTGQNYPNTNTFTNNSFLNIYNSDLIIGQNINEITLIDQSINSYNFTRNISSFRIIDTIYGEIKFLNNISGNGNNLSSDILIFNNSAYINSSKPGLNVSANITLNGIGDLEFILPSIFRDGLICNAQTSPSCYNYTSLTDETIIFNISKGGNYSIGEGGDITPPIINFSYPTEYQSVKKENNIFVNVSVNDSSNVNTTIYLYNESSLVNQTSSLTYSLFVNFTNLEEGNYSFNATACDENNNCNSTPTRNILIDFPPIINLLSPVQEAGILSNNVNLTYNITDSYGIDYCRLIINGIVNMTNNSPSIGQNSFTINLNPARYSWSINCTDTSGNENYSEIRMLNRISESTFSGQTTDLSQVNIQNVSNLIIDSPLLGKINFTQNVNLSGAYNLFDYINISHNLIRINSNSLPNLNVSAILTLNNINLQKPVILRDGVVCSECNILSYEDSEIIFNVNHFSAYSTSENARLEIFDDSDNSAFYGGTLTFYANYTNITDNSAITGADCRLNINNTENVMNYNMGSNLYTYSLSLFDSGTHNYSINCSSSNFANINLTDFAYIQNSSIVPNGAQVNQTSSQRSIATQPQNNSASAGNVSEISIYASSISQSWQGYYGNVSGVVRLTDAEGNVFYNWSQTMSLGEVYASRSNNINFQTIQCATPLQISQEETLVGQSVSDIDKISSTFTSNSHPEFYVGNIKINQDYCKSTNIYSENVSSFYEVLLSDISSNIVYTSLLENDKIGFNNKPSDFEMIVPEDGHADDTSSTPYYFYMEIG